MKNFHQYWVYMMSNTGRTVLYTGVTNDLYRRYTEHRNGTCGGFTKRYNCRDLIYAEEFGSVEEAIAREKTIKNWSRARKDALVRSANPSLKNIAEDLFAE